MKNKKVPPSITVIIMIACAMLHSCTPISVKVQKDKGIRFENTYPMAIVAKAQREGKLIFIDAYTGWCMPCKMMATNVFTNDEVAQFYNENFINVKIDMGKDIGSGIAKRYGVKWYPTFLFIDGTGKLVHRKIGTCMIQEFITLGEDAKEKEKNNAL